MWKRQLLKSNGNQFLLSPGRSVTFSPEVELTINYCGKRVQMSHGPIMGLIMGLGQLNCSKIKLKKINYRRGLLGIDRVLHYLVKEWLNHIKNRQLPSLLQGIGPMNSIVIFCEFNIQTHPKYFLRDHSDWPAIFPFFDFHSPRCHRSVPIAVRTISAWRTHCAWHSTGCTKFHLSHSSRCLGTNNAIDLFVAGKI